MSASPPPATSVEAAARNGSAIVTVAGVEKAFAPEHVAAKRLSGRIHYQAILKHVLGTIQTVSAYLIEAVRSVQAAAHTAPREEVGADDRSG